jgi:Xaa-Pro aminopeptidase
MKSAIQPEKITKLSALKLFLNDLGLKNFCVKEDFPIRLADGLRAAGFAISVAEFSVLPQRLVKSDFEIAEVRKAIEIARKTFAHATAILANSSINAKNELVFDGEILTSERLRTAMESFCFHLGGIGEDTIVACGVDACDPHNLGFGPLEANKLILIDFFPRLRSSGYHADVSRTFVKGHPSAEQTALRNAVQSAHDMAISMVHSGVRTRDVMAAVLGHFENLGYKSSNLSSPPHGMSHSLGHGFGLDIHEPPRVGMCDDILQRGMVVTIEPGLYYQQIGGVRIEDDILIGDDTSEVLSQIPCDWIIE